MNMPVAAVNSYIELFKDSPARVRVIASKSANLLKKRQLLICNC